MSIFWNTTLPIMSWQKVSQVDLATHIGKGKTTVNQWIKFDRIPPADYALKIADFLGEDLRYLITGEQSGESRLYYTNKKIKPVVDLLEQEDDTIITQALIGVKTAIEVHRQLNDSKREDYKKGTA